MAEHEEETAVVVADVSPGSLVAHDPTAALANTEKLVKYMSGKTGREFISIIQGRKYPKVEWWTTVGLALGLSPVEISSERIEEDERNYKYLAKVEVRRGDQVVTSASAICSTKEKSWGQRDEYAVKSMATTRATGKAYRIGLSALAVMAGLEPTPADEIPPQGFNDAPQDKGHGICAEHGVPYSWTDRQQATGRSPSHKTTDGWCEKPAEAAPAGREVSEAQKLAVDALEALHGSGTANQAARVAYIKEILGRDINHPDEITEDEWEAVRAAATEEMADDPPVEEDPFG